MPTSHTHEHYKHIALLLTIVALCALLLALTSQGYELGRLPGDLATALSEYNIYFPLTTAVLVSATLNLSAYLCFSLIRHHLHVQKEHREEEEGRAEDALKYPK